MKAWTRAGPYADVVCCVSRLIEKSEKVDGVCTATIATDATDATMKLRGGAIYTRFQSSRIATPS
jgi:hypothetical protein